LGRILDQQVQVRKVPETVKKLRFSNFFRITPLKRNQKRHQKAERPKVKKFKKERLHEQGQQFVERRLIS